MAENRDSGTEDSVIARQWHSRHVSAATNQDVEIVDLLEVVFSVGSMLRLYSEDQQKKLVSWSSSQ
jgi:hypothetical protein